MAIHHLFNEDDTSRFCPYCRIEIPESRWNSSFHALSHYKTTKCNCGKYLSIKVQLQGSGHDKWNDQNPLNHQSGKVAARKEKGTIKTIEDQIKIVEEKKGAHS